MTTRDEEGSANDGRTEPLSAARLGEAVAHLGHFRAEPPNVVLSKLGYEPTAFYARAADTRQRLAAALGTVDVAEVLAFSRGFDATDRRLKARQPKLDSIRIDPDLEPVLTERTVAPRARIAPLEPLPSATEDARPKAPIAVPSYLLAGAGAPTPAAPPAPIAAPAPAPPPPPHPPAMEPPVSPPSTPPPVQRPAVERAPLGVGTAAVDMDAVRKGIELAAKRQAAAAAAEGQGSDQASKAGSPAEVGTAVLAAIAVEIRRGATTAAAISRYKLTESAWQAAVQKIVADPASKRVFDEEVQLLLRAPQKG